MSVEKRTLSLEDIDALSAVVLPDREEMALVNVFVTNVLNGNTVQVPITAAAAICGVSVTVLASQLAQGPVSCTAGAHSFTVAP